MRRVLSGVSRSVAVLALLVGGAGRAGAGPLNPGDFPLSNSGAFPSTTGMYKLDTSGTPTLSGPGGTFTGVVSNGVAVFDFNAINVVTGQVINGTGPLPAALLSRDGITVSGGINFSGSIFGEHGPGGFNGGSGPGAGGVGGDAFVGESPGHGPRSYIGGGGGGGFGGVGGAGGNASTPFLPPPLPPPLNQAFAPGGIGGGTYGNLLFQLQGGSGGAGGFPFFGSRGVGGGGAIEFGAVHNISVSGSVFADSANLSGLPSPGPLSSVAAVALEVASSCMATG